MNERHPGTVHLLSLFEYEHLATSNLRDVSASYSVLAHNTAAMLQDGQELSACLRKLVEAKDCAVRQAVIDSRSDQ